MPKSKRELLSLCEAISNRGGLKNFNPGDTVARGFSDFGYEEFIFLENNNVISTISWTKSLLHQSSFEHLFLVPNSNQTFIELERYNVVVQSIVKGKNNDWIISAQNNASDEMLLSRDEDFQYALLKMLAKVLTVDCEQIDSKSKRRNLKAQVKSKT
jgi:predicted nuclease of predicted toxin-antitoxin system